MSAVVGIDLGTTNTVVGVVQAGHVLTVPNERGERLLPSVVSFHPSGSVLVGRDAKDRRMVDPRNTVSSTKRLIGRSFGSKAVQTACGRASFEIREGPGQGTLIVARAETYTLPEISAFVLREARRMAQVFLHDSVDRAVITVPASFNDLQRAATKVAGRIAGLEVIRILNEPTAAALAYGYGKGSQERIAVYDFGGGTFDVTLLDLAGNVFEVLATAGDTFLGGDDVDQLIAERVAHEFLKKHRYDVKADAQAWEHVLSAAEQLKIQVTNTGAPASHTFQDVVFGIGGKSLELVYTLTPQELTSVALPLVDRTLSVCADAMSSARLEPSAFDQVILVGGTTRMAVVRDRVAQFFRRKPLDRLNADEVVALGAAIQAAALTGADRKRAVVGERDSISDSPPGALPGDPRRASMDSLRDATAAAAPAGAAPGASTTQRGLAAPPPPPPAARHPATSPVAKLDDDPFAMAPVGGVRAPPPPLPPPLSPPKLGPSGTAIRTNDPAHAAQVAAAVAAATAATSLVRSRSSMDLGPSAVAPPPPALAPKAGGEAIATRQAPPRAAMPLLIDVTPLSLAVETVGGYADVIIERNTPVPCERTRMFATARDNQVLVRVNIAQGESVRFVENAILGQLELTGLRPAPRGETKIAVTFELDTDGILAVRAVDQATGASAAARIKLGGGVPEGAQVAAMAARVRQRSG